MSYGHIRAVRYLAEHIGRKLDSRQLSETAMAQYGKKASEKVHKALHEEKHGQLKSGSGKKVTSRKQAIAIGLSQARKSGGKVPKPSAKR